MSDQPTPEAPPAEPAPEAPAEEVTPEAPAAPEVDPAALLSRVKQANAQAASERQKARKAQEVAETATKTADELAAKVPNLEAQLLRAQVALELGIPAALAGRLQGSTREEVMADAETLLTLIAPKAPAQTVRPVEALKPGSGAAPEAPSLESQIDAAHKAGNWQAVIALENQRHLTKS